MGLKSQLLEVIEWKDNSRDTIVYQFPVNNSEIKNGASLTVRESQVAVFVCQGQIADIFGPGRHTLHTGNIPVITKIMSWKHGFKSPFKAEVYFINIRQFTDNKWGTATPVMKSDARYEAIRFKAYGSFFFSIADPAIFVRECLGTPNLFKKDNIISQLRSVVVSGFTEALGELPFAALEVASKLTELGLLTKEKAGLQAARLGIVISNVTVESVSLPAEVEKMLDSKTSMNIIGGGNMGTFTQLQTANMLQDAARTPNSMGALATGLTAMQMLHNTSAQAMSPAATAAPQIACPYCGFSNGQGVKFCGNCGKQIKIEQTTCNSCGAKIGKDLKFCPECGANQTIKTTCPSCNTQLSPNDRFCSGCGAKVK